MVNVIPWLLYIWERDPVPIVQEVHIVFLSWHVSEPTPTHSQVDKTQDEPRSVYNLLAEKPEGLETAAEMVGL